MRCVICKNGKTEDGFTTVTLEKSRATLIFKNVPALVCDNCGEKYLLKSVKDIVKSGVEIDIRDYGKVA